MAPVGRGYFKMESLTDGTLTLWHIALANDHIATVAENQRRAQKKNQRQ